MQKFTGYWFSIAFRHSFRFTASSDVKFLCFMTLSTSFSHFTSDHLRRSLPSVGDVIIRLGHLGVLIISSSFFFPNHFCYPHFSPITSFLTFNSLEVLAVLLQKSVSVLSSYRNATLLYVSLL